MDTLLIIICVVAILLAIAVVYQSFRLAEIKSKVITISDTLPQSCKRQVWWMKLSNEGKSYLHREGDRVTLKIYKD